MKEKTGSIGRALLLSTAIGFGLGGVLLAVGTARADDAAPAAGAAPAAAPAAAPFDDSIKFGFQAEGGITFNPDSPKNNFGQLFTDKPNQLTLNQALFTLIKPVDPKATDFAWGFKIQGMVGTDARYTRLLGLYPENSIAGRYQVDLVEANVSMHLPVLTDGGMDVKAGVYPTPLGFETIDPSTNPFYTHSYIFNFGIPLKHTGVYGILHASDLLDVYGGVDTGEQTTFGAGDNNDAVAGLAGVNLTLADGNLTVLALSHFGPEQAKRAIGSAADSKMRYENDAVITWKVSDALTLVTELNYIYDEYGFGGGKAGPTGVSAYGAAEYAAYTLNDTVTLNGRAEIYRDSQGYFVGAFPRPTDFSGVELGLPSAISVGPGVGTTYSELTVGLTVKPPALQALNVQIRPEARYDRTLNSVDPFDNGKKKDAITLSTDVVMSF